jgi:hypothetical protein
MLLFVTLLFLRGSDMILARLWIVQHEFTIFESGAFDRGRTYDATLSLARIDALIMTLNGVRTILFFCFP